MRLVAPDPERHGGDGSGAPGARRRRRGGGRPHRRRRAGPGRRGGPGDRRHGAAWSRPASSTSTRTPTSCYDTCPSAESKVRQGVTTEVVGMCGFSPAPVAAGPRGLVREWAGGIGGKLARHLDTASASTSTTCAALGLTVNVVQFVGHGALRLRRGRGCERGRRRRTSSGAWSGCSAEALDAGAFGLLDRARVRAQRLRRHRGADRAGPRAWPSRGGLYFSHIRGEAATLEQAVEEAIRIGERGRGARADRPRQGLGPRELGQDGARRCA